MRRRGFFIKSFSTAVLLFAVFCLFSISVKANEGHANLENQGKSVDSTLTLDSVSQEAAHAEEEFNPSELILEHIADSHDWHLWGHTSFHLPVILYTDKGLEVFSSGKFHHGEESHQGKYYTYALIHEHINVVDSLGVVNEEASKNITDLSITKNVASMFLSMIVLVLIFLSVAMAYRKTKGKAPKGFQSLMEPVIMFVRDDIAKPNLGYKYARFMPFLLTIFFFILINNLIGLIPFFPGGSNLTGNIAFTLVMGLITFVVTNLNGNKSYWKHIFMPHVPLWLYPIMIPVEIMGVLSKPFALIVRLFANITAGHIIVLSLISLIFIFKTLAIAPVSVAFVLFMDVLELLVAFLQAFIFTMLTALFIGTAIEDHHAEEEAHANGDH